MDLEYEKKIYYIEELYNDLLGRASSFIENEIEPLLDEISYYSSSEEKKFRDDIKDFMSNVTSKSLPNGISEIFNKEYFESKTKNERNKKIKEYFNNSYKIIEEELSKKMLKLKEELVQQKLKKEQLIQQEEKLKEKQRLKKEKLKEKQRLKKEQLRQKKLIEQEEAEQQRLKEEAEQQRLKEQEEQEEQRLKEQEEQRLKKEAEEQRLKEAEEQRIKLREQEKKLIEIREQEKRLIEIREEKERQIIPIYSHSKNFPYGRACPHCLWLENDEYLYKKYLNQRMMHVGRRRIQDTKNLEKIFQINPPDKKTIGVTIFDNHLVFKNSLLCVLGLKTDTIERHNYKNIASVIKGAYQYIRSELNRKYKITKIRLLINSHVEKKLHGRDKEHLHVWITLMDEREAADFFKNTNNGGKEKDEPGSTKFDKDILLDITHQECVDLLMQDDSTISPYLNTLVRGKNTILGSFNIDTYNFYMMLNFDFETGKIKGKISVALPPKVRPSFR
jgi:hypothetical protein